MSRGCGGALVATVATAAVAFATTVSVGPGRAGERPPVGALTIGVWRHAGAQIWTVETDGSNRRFLVSGRQPEWSPDGRRIAFVRAAGDSGEQVVVAAADGRHARVLVDHVEYVNGTSWSPDARRIAYQNGEQGIWIAGPGAGQTSFLTDGVWPAWSPDGRFVAVVKNGSVWLANAATGTVRFVARPATYPQWSPDGRAVLYVRGAKPHLPGRHLMLWTRSTHRIRRLARIDALVGRAVWSPDGRSIAFAVRPADPHANACLLYTMASSGREPPRRIRSLIGASCDQIAWRPSAR
jgi:Tol biopolymer transport system component